MYLNDIFTVAANLTGAPAISIPCGFDRNGLPIGLQIQGDYFAEAQILDVAHRFQQATDWHQSPTSREKRLVPPKCDDVGPAALTRAARGRSHGRTELGSRHRARDARAALHGGEDLLGRVDRVRRRAEHARVRRRHRAARRAAGAEQRRGRARDPLRARRRRRRSTGAACSRARITSTRIFRRATRSRQYEIPVVQGGALDDRTTDAARNACGSPARISRKTPARACTRTSTA